MDRPVMEIFFQTDKIPRKVYRGSTPVQHFKVSGDNILKHVLRLTQQKHHPVFE